MATAAQIEANRRNAQNVHWPEDRGRQGEGQAQRPEARRAGQGRRAGAAPGGPRGAGREDPPAGSRTCSPWDDAERDLVARAAKLSWLLDRDRAVRDRRAGRAGASRPSSRSDVEAVERVCDLGRKLLYNAGPRILPVSGPPWDDNPAAFLCGLESTAEGCRWLLERWTVLGDMLERGAIWTLTDLYRSIRLQGKHPVDAVNDPELNLQIQAWEMMSPGAAVDFWERCYHQTPKVDPGFQGFMEWREIADRPAD